MMYLSFWLPLKLLSTHIGVLLAKLEHKVAQTWQISMKRETSGTNLLKDLFPQPQHNATISHLPQVPGPQHGWLIHSQDCSTKL